MTEDNEILKFVSDAICKESSSLTPNLLGEKL